MCAKYRYLLSTLVLACALIASPAARAVVINANDYAVGTNVSNVLPGVTLSYVTDMQGTMTQSPLVISTGDPVSNQNEETNTLGPWTSSLGTHIGDPPQIDQIWLGVYAQFAQPIYSITTTGFVSTGIPSIILAYGTTGNLIGYTETSLSTGYYCLYYVSEATGKETCYENGEHTSFTSTTPIGSVLVGSVDDEGYVTEINIPGVPEPSSLALFAAGLLAIGFLTSRRWRRPAVRRALSALVLVSALLAAPGAQAVVINAADYSVGANLTDAIPGAILQFATYSGGPGFITSPLVIGTDTLFSDGGPTQFKTFGGSTDDAGYPPFQELPPPFGGWDAVYVAFTVPVYSVSAVGYNEDDDAAAMVAFGANGQQLDVEIDNGGPLSEPCIPSPYPGIACLESHEETVTSSTPISYVLFGGLSETTYYTAIDIPGVAAVSEPSSLALLGGCILAISGAVLSRRRGGWRNYRS